VVHGVLGQGGGDREEGLGLCTATKKGTGESQGRKGRRTMSKCDCGAKWEISTEKKEMANTPNGRGGGERESNRGVLV